MIYDYDILWAVTKAELVDLVKGCLLKGWEPIGGLTIGIDGKLFQAIVKRGE